MDRTQQVSAQTFSPRKNVCAKEIFFSVLATYGKDYALSIFCLFVSQTAMTSLEEYLLKAVREKNVTNIRYALGSKLPAGALQKAHDAARTQKSTDIMELLIPGSTAAQVFVGGTPERRMVIGAGSKMVVSACNGGSAVVRHVNTGEGAEINVSSDGGSTLMQNVHLAGRVNVHSGPRSTIVLNPGPYAKTTGETSHIFINGHLVDASNWPIGVELEIQLGQSSVRCIRNDRETISVASSSFIHLQPVPHSVIYNFTAFATAAPDQAVDQATRRSEDVPQSSAIGRKAEERSPLQAIRQKPDEVQQSIGTRAEGVQQRPTSAPFSISRKADDLKHEKKAEIELKLVQLPQKGDAFRTVLLTECCVCLNAETTGAFVPCAHKCCCLSCGAKLTTCPLCQAKGTFMHISLLPATQKLFA